MSLPAVSSYNQLVVLDVVRREREGLSRVAIAQRTGLSPQAVSNVARRLLDSGLIRESGKLISGPGKPRTLLRLAPRSGFAVGVHIDPAVVTSVVVDLEGTVVARSRRSTAAEGPPGEALAAMARSIESLVVDAGIDRTLLLGVGIASPGPIDVDSGVVLDPPRIPGWRDVHLQEALTGSTGLPVLLEKDVTSAAVAEQWFSAGDERRNFAFVYYGTGMGMGLVAGGAVLRGASSNAGDTAHLTVDADGPPCSCGRRGCVGDLVSPYTLVRRAVEAGVLDAGPADVELDAAAVDAAATQLAAAVDRGEPAAVAIVRDAAVRLARAVVVVVNLLDLDHVVFGGPFWSRIAPVVLDVLPDAVQGSRALVPKHPITISESVIGEDVAAVGAACLVLDNAFSPDASAQPIVR